MLDQLGSLIERLLGKGSGGMSEQDMARMRDEWKPQQPHAVISVDGEFVSKHKTRGSGGPASPPASPGQLKPPANFR